MQRRSFIKSSAIASGAILTGSVAKASAGTKMKSAAGKQDFILKYAPHFGMFRHSAGEDLLDQLQFMADAGFTAFEDNGMMKRDIAMQTKIGETLVKLNMTMGVFVVDKGGNLANTLAAGKKENLDIFLDGCKRAVEVAKRVNAKWMTVVPGFVDMRQHPDYQRAYVIEALKRGAEIFEPHGLVMVLEPLNFYNHPGLFLTTVPQAYEICKAVDSPACKILDDLYHVQIQEGNLIPNINMAYSEIAAFHLGDNPGRKEPTTGEINYKNIFKHIYNKGFDGVLCMEHGKSKRGKDGEKAVIDAYRECDDF